MKKLQQLFDGSRFTNLISIGEGFEPLFSNEIQHVLDEGSEVLVFSDKLDLYKKFEEYSNFYLFKDYSKTVDDTLMGKDRFDRLSWVYFDYSNDLSEDILIFAERLFTLGRVHNIIPSVLISDITLFYKQCDAIHFDKGCFIKGANNIVIGSCKFNSFDFLVTLVFEFIGHSFRWYNVSKVFSNNIDFLRQAKYMRKLRLSYNYVSSVMEGKSYCIWINGVDVMNPSVHLCRKK